MIQQFIAALSDDLNVSEGIGTVFSWLREPVTDAVLAAGVINAIDSVLGFRSRSIRYLTPGTAIAEAIAIDADLSIHDQDPGIISKAKAIDDARARKDFGAADRLRKELQEAGYEVMTTKTGTTARKKLA